MNTLRKLATGLLNSILVFTFIMLPNAMNLRHVNVGVAYAAGAAGCVDENGKKVDDYYHKGCAFEAEEMELSDWGNKTETAAEIINYIFLVIMSAAFIATLGNQMPTIARRDCPQNNAPTITVNILRGAAIGYIIQELLISSIYKGASKSLAEHNVQNSKTEANKDEQLESFDKLIEGLEKMKKATKAKRVLHAILEAAYGTALGIEVGNIIGCNGTCSAGLTAAITQNETGLTAYSTAVTNFTASFGAEYAIAPEVAAEFSTLCTPLQSAVTADFQLVMRVQAGIKARSAARTSDVSSRGIFSSAEAPARLGALLSPAMAVTTAASATTAEGENRSRLHAMTKAEMGQDATVLTLTSEEGGEFGGNSAALTSTGAACIVNGLPAIEAGCSKTTIGAAKCIPAVGAAHTKLAEAYQEVITARTMLFKAWATPVMCCGSIPGAPTPLLWSGPSVKPNFENTIDYVPVEALANNDIKPPLAPEDFLNNKKQESMFKALVYSGMMNYYITRSLKKNSDPNKIAAQLVSFDKRARALMDANPKDLLQRPLSTSEITLALENNDGFKQFKHKKEMANFISNLTSQFFMPSAMAFDWGNFLTKLGVTAGVMLIANMIRSFLQFYLLATPMRRSILYGFMAGLGATQIILDTKALKNIKDYIKIVEDERQRFLDAAAMDVAAGEGDPDSQGGSTATPGVSSETGSGFGGGDKTLDCEATLGTDGATPAIIRKGELISMACELRGMMPSGGGVPSHREMAGNSGGLDLSGAQPLNAMFNGLVNSAAPGNDNIQNGDYLASARGVSNAMKNQNKKLLDKYESMLKDKKDKKGTLLAGIQSANAVVAAFDSGNLTAAVAQAQGGVEEIKKESKLATLTKNIKPRIGIPALDPNANVGFSFEDDTKKVGVVPEHGLRDNGEKSLADFEIQYNDINQKAGVSIFKLLSNRYIIQYPKLLEKINSRKKDLPVAKNEKAKPATKKSKLKKMLDNPK